MNVKKKDYIIYIGRFQPSHLAHIKIIREALSLAKKVIIIIGSADQPRTQNNPFTWMEREAMIRASLPDDVQDNILMMPARDKVSNSKWVEQVQKTVDVFTNEGDEIAVIGHSKDETSYYLEMFPQWGTPIDVGNIEDIHASDVREALWTADDENDFELKIGRNLPRGIHDYLQAFMLREEYAQLRREYEFNKVYKRAWDWHATLSAFVEKDLPEYFVTKEEQSIAEQAIVLLRNRYKVAPYANNFVTVDALVVQSGHILLIKRRSEPGKGLYAMPGGHVNQNERLDAATIRELYEETKLKIPPKVLLGSIKERLLVDDPKRSLRGRTYTQVSLIKLPDGPLPKVKGSDDAVKAKWIPLNVFQQMEDQMFEDHFRIINELI